MATSTLALPMWTRCLRAESRPTGRRSRFDAGFASNVRTGSRMPFAAGLGISSQILAFRCWSREHHESSLRQRNLHKQLRRHRRERVELLLFELLGDQRRQYWYL